MKFHYVLCANLAASLLSGCTAKKELSNSDAAVKGLFAMYGGPGFSQVEWIQFTFNVGSGDTVRASREWSWSPDDGWVTCREATPDGDTVSVMYNHKDVAGNARADSNLVKVDKKFVNDSYWLLFPLQVGWDTTVAVTYDSVQPLPIGSGAAHRLSVRYPSQRGYTPGDMYRLYYGDDFIIKQWTFHRGGDPEAGRPSRWDAPKQVGPLKLTLTFYGPDDRRRLWFTNVSLKLKESERELAPQ